MTEDARPGVEVGRRVYNTASASEPRPSQGVDEALLLETVGQDHSPYLDKFHLW
jgi:hypothetical protein